MPSPTTTNSYTQLNAGSLVFGHAQTLTDAQVKALPTTPITLIAAPGTGKRIKILYGTARLNSTAGAYTNISSAYCVIQIENPNGDWLAGPVAINDNTMATALTTVTDSFGTAGNLIIDFAGGLMTPINSGAASGGHQWSVATGFPGTANVDNALVRISADNNGAGVFTGGNSANTLLITLYYAVELV